MTAADGTALPTALADTMLRIDLPEPLKPGENTSFSVSWSFNIIDAETHRARGGYEVMGEDENAIGEAVLAYQTALAQAEALEMPGTAANIRANLAQALALRGWRAKNPADLERMIDHLREAGLSE